MTDGTDPSPRAQVRGVTTASRAVSADRPSLCSTRRCVGPGNKKLGKKWCGKRDGQAGFL